MGTSDVRCYVTIYSSEYTATKMQWILNNSY